MRIVAHRGASAQAPENTLAAFRLGWELGAHAVETDLHATRDGVLVCIHDPTLERTTAGRGEVETATWEAISELDAGSWYSAAFAQERLPTLNQFMELADGRPVCLEMKSDRAADVFIERFAGAAESQLENVELTAFDWRIVHRLRAAMPGVFVGHLCDLLDEAEIDRAVHAGLGQIAVKADGVSVRGVEAAHRRGLRIRAWHIMTPQRLQELRHAGIDDATLDDPTWGLI